MSAEEPIFKITRNGSTVNYLRLDNFSDVGTGETASAHVTVSTHHGNNIVTDGFDQFDEFVLTMRDIRNVVFERTMYLETMLPQETVDGQTMGLELHARENYLRKILMPGLFVRIRLHDLFNEIITHWNAVKGSNQPSIRWTVPSDFPMFAYGTFDFADNTNCYDALMQVISLLNLSVPAGGAGDYFELLFTDHSSGDLEMHIIPQGSRADTPHTIQGRGMNTLKTLQIKDAIKGDMVILRGAQSSGTMPAIWEEIEAKLEEFNNFPEWDSTIAYKTDVHVRYQNAVYKATADVPAGRLPTAAGWTAVSKSSYLPAESQITNKSWNLLNIIKSYLGNNSSTSYDTAFTSPCFPDCNLVVKEEGDLNFRRTRADHRAKSWAGVHAAYGAPQEGVRVLVDDAASGSLGTPFGSGTTYGTDINGVSYRNNVAQYDGEKWIVAFVPQQGYQVVITKEGAAVYEWQGPTDWAGTNPNPRRSQTATSSQLAWRNIQNSYLGFDCLHYPSSIAAARTLVGKAAGYTGSHAVKIEYTVNEPVDTGTFLGQLFQFTRSIPGINLINALFQLTVGREVFNFGWWCTLFEAPSPTTSRGSNTIGGKYKQSLLNLYNMNRTPSGMRGWEHADSGELGQLDGIRFAMNFRIMMGTFKWPAGDTPFRVCVYDSEDNVWVRDFVYRHHGATQDINLPFSSFQLYRAREPHGLTLDTILSNVTTPEIHLWEVFEKRRVRLITLHCLLSYDEHGRYSPFQFDNFAKLFVTTLVNQTLKHIGTIDQVCFTKSPYAIVKSTSTRRIMHPVINYPSVVNYEQLKAIAQAELDLKQHRLNTVTVKIAGNCAIRAGDSIYLQDQDLTTREDKTGTAHTIKLAVRKVSHRINASDSGTGGHTTELSTYRRINA